MKVLYLNRAKTPGRFSFEGLFGIISSNLDTFSCTHYFDKTKRWLLQNILAIRKNKPSIYHITGGIGYYSFFLPKKRTILTIHDTNHYENDLHGLRKWLFSWLIYRLPIANVKFATVVSEHTKSRLIKLFNINPEKIRVVPNCYPESFKYSPRENYELPTRILQIGTKENKNILRLIKALKGLDIELTIIGKLDATTKKSLEESRIKYFNKFNLSTEEIYNEYINTHIVSFVSLCEGFGLPIIEANAIGRPVITSNTCSMPQVAGNAAHIVDPYNIDDIRLGFEKIINESDYRETLVKNGIDNCKSYEPKKIAALYEQLYMEIISSNELKSK